MIRFPTNGKPFKSPKGHIIQGFGENPDVYAGFGLAGHDGWDILPEIGYGENLYCPVTGTVVRAYFNGQGLGNQIHILSDDTFDGWQLFTELGHMTDTQLVKEGDKVYMGQIIGHMGNSGFTVSGGVKAWGNSNPDKKGTHTHWLVRWLKENNSPSNTSYFGKNYLIKDFNNGFKGAFDPETLRSMFMTNVKLIKHGNEFAFYVPITNEQAAIDKALNFNYPLPTLENGSKVDWANVRPDITI